MNETITPDYLELNRELHRRRPDYGLRGSNHAPMARSLCRRTGCVTVLDYGAGKATLAKALEGSGILCHSYDPAVPGLDGPPPRSGVVVCTDVLEHIEPHLLPAVLADIDRLARKAIYLIVAMRPDSSKLLADGSNPHKIIEQWPWWVAALHRAWPGWRLDEQHVVPGKAASSVWLREK